MSSLVMWSAHQPESTPVQALSRSPIIQFQHQLSSALQPSRAILLSALFHTRSSTRVSSQHELFRALSLESAQAILAELICPEGSAFLLLVLVLNLTIQQLRLESNYNRMYKAIYRAS